MIKNLPSLSYLFFFLFIYNYAIAQSPAPAQKKSQYISEDRLKNAKIVEELIVLFPAELEIVSCRISIAGKDIKYSEHVLGDHTLPDLFKNVHAGHKVFIEYILAKKKGSYSTAVAAYDPIELVVTKDSK